jgi:sec-independent protein translocase protein TatC
VEKSQGFLAKFAPYVEDIRKRLYVIAITFAVFFVAGFFSTSVILRYILGIFKIQDVVIATTSPFQFADLSINIGLLCACVVVSPVALYNIFMFLRPALTKYEKKIFFLLMPLTLVLFFFGFAYGFSIMYYALIILAQINMQIGVQNIWDIGMFLSQIVLTSTLLGVLFQFPIVFTFILRSGLLDISYLKQKRRLAFVIIFVFTAFLPPTDGLSLIAMALPLVLMYEVTILVNSKIWRHKKSIGLTV